MMDDHHSVLLVFSYLYLYSYTRTLALYLYLQIRVLVCSLLVRVHPFPLSLGRVRIHPVIHEQRGYRSHIIPTLVSVVAGWATIESSSHWRYQSTFDHQTIGVASGQSSAVRRTALSSSVLGPHRPKHPVLGIVVC